MAHRGVVVRAVALACTCLCAVLAHAADGVFVPAPDRVDVVHDAARNRVYISAGDRILRYSTKYDVFRSPIILGGRLSGIDVSPDGSTLVVADLSYTSNRVWVWLVDLETLAVRKAEVPSMPNETGTFTAVFAGNGTVLTTSDYGGSGWVPMRRLDLGSDRWTSIADLRNFSMLAVSGDGSRVAFAESDTSDGAWGTYDVASKRLVRREGYTDGTSWYNFEIGADRTGSRFLIPTAGGGLVYDSAYQRAGTVGQAYGPRPLGIAYHPVEPLLYVPFLGTDELRAYDANTLAPAGSWHLGPQFSMFYNFAFVRGRTRISRDGSLLMVTIDGGVQLIRQYAPLRAEPVAATVAPGGTVDVPLLGSIGNGASLDYVLVDPPSGRQASIVNGNTLRYSAPKGATGRIAFRYQARYGLATATADVVIDVLPAANRAPVARPDIVPFRAGQPLVLRPLANDRDPDGDRLRLVGLLGNTRGRATIDGDVLRYVPGLARREQFEYLVSDGRGGIARARVVLQQVADP